MTVSPSSARPNILVLMTDQQRFDALGCAGNSHIRTPNLDKLAEHGVRFSTCYCQSPICSPSRATYATGLYPHNHGLWANGVSIPDSLPLLSKTLADNGYDCGMAGKQHLAPCSVGDEPRLDDGYRVYKWSHDPINASPNNSYHLWLKKNHPEVFRSAIEQGLSGSPEQGNVAKGATAIDTVATEAHYSRWIAEEAIAFACDENRTEGQPFYFMANFFDPHHPFGAPEEFRALYDADALPLPSGSAEELKNKPAVQREYNLKSYGGNAPGFAEYTEAELRDVRASYYAMVSMIDAEVGRIMEALDRCGQLENTLIIFTSDHGELLGDHAIMLKGPMLYEPLVRVPLIMSWPNHLPEGKVVEQIVQNIDITSTILDVAGVADKFEAQGESLMPLASGDSTEWRDWAICEYRDSGFAGDPAVHTTMLRQGGWKLVVWHGVPATLRERDGELYNLDTDPGEHANLYHDPKHAGDRERMKDTLIDVMAATEWPRPERTASW